MPLADVFAVDALHAVAPRPFLDDAPCCTWGLDAMSPAGALRRHSRSALTGTAWQRIEQRVGLAYQGRIMGRRHGRDLAGHRWRLRRLCLQDARRRPAGLRGAGRLPAADRDPHPRRRRPAAGRVRAREAGSSCRSTPCRAHGRQAFVVGRGQELLQPPRHRPGRHRAGGLRQLPGARHQPPAAGRLDHHPAGGQELLAHQRGLARAQAQGGDPGLPHRAGLHQGPHPRALSERDLSRPPAPMASPPPRSTISTSRSTS